MLIIQLIAIAGSAGGALLSNRIGNIKTLIIFNIIWFLICIVAYFIKYSFEFYINCWSCWFSYGWNSSHYLDQPIQN